MRALGAIVIALLAGCNADPLNLEGRACGAHGECVSGFVCDSSRNVCVHSLPASGGGAGGGVAGSTSSGGSSGAIATGGTAGSGGSAGTDAGGAAGSNCGGTRVDCDGNPANGCERDLATDLEHCGACGRACASDNTEARVCENGVCSSSCALGFSNCTQPAAPAADDGCELKADQTAACGGCANDCALQGGSGGFVCDATSKRCACTTSASCGSPAGSSCNVSLGVCDCGTTVCNSGETCKKTGSTTSCTCNDNAPCAQGQSCCEKPAGCRDLASDATNCGACGRSCAPGFVCQSGECRCDGDADCASSSGGTCVSGKCVCSGVICGAGERCTALGACG